MTKPETALKNWKIKIAAIAKPKADNINSHKPLLYIEIMSFKRIAISLSDGSI